MSEVRPATPGSFDEVWPLLAEFHSTHMTRDDWRRMLFDLPWAVEEPTRGYILSEAGRAVGFLGTIFSRRMIGGRERRFCNLSSWIVRPAQRAAALQLVLPVLALKDYTIVNFTASAAAHEIFSRLGFVPLETAQHLVPWLPRSGELLRWPASRSLTDPAAMRTALDDAGRRVLDDHLGTHAAQVMITAGARRCHVVAVRSPWKGRWRLAHVVYASDWPLLLQHPARVNAALFRACGTVGLRLEARHVAAAGVAIAGLPPFTRTRALASPTLYRPAAPEVTPADVDGLYSELVGQPW